MTPKEKADQLINSFIPQVRWKMGQEDIMQRAKQCALIAVNEILDALLVGDVDIWDREQIEYWEQVKTEIEKL